MNTERFINLVTALRESKNPDKFTMDRVMHPCGTPACVLGHYAHRTDLQDAFKLLPSISGDCNCFWRGVVDSVSGQDVAILSPKIQRHFEITESEAEDFFQADGCGGARTPEEAIAFIEKRLRFQALDELIRISEEMRLYDF